MFQAIGFAATPARPIRRCGCVQTFGAGRTDHQRGVGGLPCRRPRKKPIHAKIDEDAPLPSDGGTHFYKGDGYELTISISLSSFGAFNGTAYGPILNFDDKFAPGNTNQISDIRVYSNEELRKLLLN